MIKKTFEEHTSAVAFVKDFIHYCGRLNSLYHMRDTTNEELFETIIIGEDKTLVVISGLTSGDASESSMALVEILEFLGLTHEDARALVINSSSLVHTIKVEF